MAYSDIYVAANDPAFQGRCYVALWKAAQDIMAESAQTANHVARKDWASNVLVDKINLTGKQLAMQVLRNATIAANPGTSTDGDLQFQINSIIDALMQVG